MHLHEYKESSEKKEIQELYGVRYYQSGDRYKYEAPASQAYYFETYIGEYEINVERGDCVYFISDCNKNASLKRGPCQVSSKHCATIIRGYMPSEVTASLEGTTLLPYVNGCSTKQIFFPPRVGDPTLQLLKIPANSAEQAHHIHSTVRVVYVLSGKGKSIVGMEGKSVEQDLLPGMVCILEPMCPHHFETPYGEPLVVIPLHVYSSTGAQETSHPMFNGTYMMNQGA
ncbi:hypothetical protein KP17_18460 [Pectobacterium parvum]|uniref:Cupin type-2 domain-containing protein n=1 Tax=Pectobacterium odoriferum TaxID=78398 RepID=A0ABD6VJG4_9GAMM|nr:MULTISPECIES: cupin domain-containing protein [Pectobacterium]KFX10456.1 hypothetical protein KP17_18460 [Pectobacterium parvum]MBB1527385.1 cupin domain-containing protein [Pectobacterium carotovorum subsp. carotovorum]POD97435.1 hypothetical protein BVY06_02975 [Pectobacterium odoriferum]POE08724.1 hypothetical protein BV924_20880 [Pectobacterium odoriferum]POE23242.1 hypothetical protein BV926_20710 [Pectobacterium odoriferum]